MEDHQANRDRVWIAMDRLSMALSTALSEDLAAVFWDALCDLPIEAVEYACQYAARHWEPREYETLRFPRPSTLREYARYYRQLQIQQAVEEAKSLLPQWTETPDHVGLDAIRKVLKALGDEMELKHPVYQHPSLDDPEKRRAELLEQARWILTNGESKE